MSMFRRRLMIANALGHGDGNINYPGLIAAWSAKGKTNDDEDRAILKDLTGNGHDITLNGFSFNTEGSGYNNPEYPDALVFDGVDDYGINENMPILTDFTIIVKRKEVSGNGPVVIKGSTSSNKSSFIFESWNNEQQWSFGYQNNVKIYEGDISFMSKNNYNGVSIKNGTASDSNSLLFGYYGYNPNYKKMVFYSAYLFDRSLDEQEIKEFIRKYIDPEYLLPSEQTTE